MKHSKKIGAITVEVAIGIALAVIVVLVTLGLFSENLSTMISNSGMANMFKNSNKTTYSSFGRDYTNSQVNVQLIGEQGLAMLRNIANNKAIAQIDKYMSGADTSVTNVNSITYLATVINAIVGSPDICVYMKKNSDKKCNEDNIGGYSYRITLNGGSITINKEGGGITPKYPTVGGDFSGGAAGITINAGSQGQVNPNGNNYTPTGISDTAIYTYIKYLSFFADESNTVYDPVILIRAINTGKNSGNGSIAQLANQLIERIFNYSASSVQIAHNNCTGYLNPDTREGDINAPALFNGRSSQECGTDGSQHTSFFVYNEDIQSINAYVAEFTGILNSFANNSNNNTVSTTDVVNTMISAPDFKNFIEILQKDHTNGTCEAFNNNIKDILQANNVDVTLPDCKPFSNENTSVLGDIWDYGSSAFNAGVKYVEKAAEDIWNEISSWF